MTENRLFYSISDISEMFDLSQPNIRHWEKEIAVLKPKRTESGIRKYSPEDIETFKLVYHLIKVKGLKLDGVNRYFKAHGIDDVAREAKIVEKLQGIKSFIEEVIVSIDSADSTKEQQVFVDNE